MLDYVCVLTPDIFESRISFDAAVAAMADHYQNNFQDSQFYKNRNNAEYVAKTEKIRDGLKYILHKKDIKPV